MKNCWKILEIEETTDVDIIRRAYLALLPSFHPETDPQGFKQLRQAYEDALRIAQSPAKSVRVTVDVNVREAWQVIFPHFCNELGINQPSLRATSN
jgi:preprotein translocase subunit Sec63